MERIDQSVAKRVLLKAYSSTDHSTPGTGLTIPVKLSVNGGAFADPHTGATNATEIANGWYYVDLDTTDTGTLGPLVVRGTEATIDDSEATFDVRPAVSTLTVADLTVVFGKFNYCRDQADTLDKFAVIWNLNGAVATGTSLGKIQIVKKDGTDLLALTSMTQVGTSGEWYYELGPSVRLTVGEQYKLRCKVTISAVEHIDEIDVSRDSS